MVAYSSNGRLRLLIGGCDVGTRYPAYGAALALSRTYDASQQTTW